MNLQNMSATHSKATVCCQDNVRRINELAAADEPAEGHQNVLLSIAGMHCGACADRIRAALMKVEGVAFAHVDFGDSAASVRFDPARTDIGTIRAAVASVGYEAGTAGEKPAPSAPSPPSASKIRARSVLFGAGAALGILGFYLGLITLTSDWYSARAQFGDFKWWLLGLAAGLGLQVGLFVHLRAFFAAARIKGATSSVAASGGMTTLSMALCCSHYVAAFLPAVGLPFLSTAVAGLAAYQVQFFFLGVISNLFGIAYMLRLMAKNGLVFTSWARRPAYLKRS